MIREVGISNSKFGFRIPIVSDFMYQDVLELIIVERIGFIPIKNLNLSNVGVSRDVAVWRPFRD